MRATRHRKPTSSMAPLVLLAVAAAGVGGYVLGSSRSGGSPPVVAPVPPARVVREAAREAGAPTKEQVLSWIAERKAQVDTLWHEANAIDAAHGSMKDWSEEYSHTSRMVYESLRSAEGRLSSVEDAAMREKVREVQRAMEGVEEALLAARNYMERGRAAK